MITAAFAVDPIRDAVTHGAVGEARLDLPAAYIALSPLSQILDTLTLVTVGQHIVIILTAILIYVAVRVVRGRREGTTIRRETLGAVILLVCIFAVYAAAAMLPRPMAGIALSDGAVLSIDFHSHTKYSHDGRPGWTEDDVRAWHEGAGFDVAYITDHRTFEGAERAIASNAGQAGEGTTLLQGIEAFYKGEHVNLLGAGRRYRGLLTPDLKDVDDQALQLASLLPATAPMMIETVPGNLSKVPAAPTSGVGGGVRAIEIVDGSPRGLSQTRREHDRIVHLADSLDLALVTGSDNHGWGRAAPGWTLMRLGPWRGMPPDVLSARIEGILLNGRRGATRAVERVIAGANNPISLIFAAPLATWRMLTTLSPDERVTWIIWTWVLFFVVRGVRRYRPRPSATA
jgi:hypothetical protein